MKYPKLHPASIKQLRKGHPWITKDKFSLDLPQHKSLIELGDNQKGESFGIFLHDPKHPKVKARKLSSFVGDFNQYIKKQLKLSIKKRSELNLNSRDNYYLCFSEADALPGLFIQKLGEHILIQYHAYVWEKSLKNIINLLKELNMGQYYWTQMRIPGEQKKAPVTSAFDTPQEAVINEFEIQYLLKFNLNHDIGIYTDMSAIRKKVSKFFKGKKKTLNLFAYTGAFSLQALHNGSSVDSVDLSKTYINWLEENIELNQFDSNQHKSHITACDRFLNKNQDLFDLIICDPPSFSSDGKKRKSSYEFYEENWKNLWNSLDKNGHLIVFLNTHSITRDKFRKLVRSQLGNEGKIVKELMLSSDCPILPNFPEGDYLKGYVISKGI